MIPRRVQLRRVKGWRMPSNTVSVARPTVDGNPYRIGLCVRWPPDFKQVIVIETNSQAVDAYRAAATDPIAGAVVRRSVKERLAGKNLACWCRLCPAHAEGKPLGIACRDCEPCHADVLLEIANGRE